MTFILSLCFGRSTPPRLKLLFTFKNFLWRSGSFRFLSTGGARGNECYLFSVCPLWQ